MLNWLGQGMQREAESVSNFGLTVRFVAVLVAAVLFTSTVTVALWAHDHMQRREDALQAHAQFVLRDLAQSLETRLSLGLPLAQLPDVERLLDGARMQMPAARSSVLVVDGETGNKGRVLFSTDPVDLGDTFSDFEAGWSGHDGHRKRGVEDIYWLAVNADDGILAGVVLLRLPMVASDKGWATLAVSLVLGAAPALALIAALAAVMGVWLARAAGRRALSTAAALGRLGQYLTLPLGGDGSGLPELPLPAFAAIVVARHRQLSEAEQALGRLDEMA